MAFGCAAPQRRITVLLRIVLLVPQYFVLFVLSIAAEFVLIVGWVAALLIGRLPDFAADFLTGYLRWQARVGAYMLLLTGVYPPFTLGDADYPARVAVRPGRLNRLAVLFRLLVSVPASLVAALLYGGACTVVLFAAWLIVLCAGQLPGPLHEAMAATLRYLTRFSGYLFLLTSCYPSGLFGDQPAQEPPVSPARAGFTAGPGGFAGPVGGFAPDSVDTASADLGIVPAAASGPAPGALGAMAPHGFTASGAGASAAAGASPVLPLASPDPGRTSTASGGQSWSGGDRAGSGPSAVAAPWQLVLTRMAKRLLALFLAFGAVGLIGFAAVIAGYAANVSHSAANATAGRQVQTAFTPLNQAMNSFAARTAQCRAAARPLACVTAADRGLGGHFGTFATALREMSVPPAAATAKGRLNAAATRAGQAFLHLGALNSAAQYQVIVGQLPIDQAMSQFAQEYTDLQTALNQP